MGAVMLVALRCDPLQSWQADCRRRPAVLYFGARTRMRAALRIRVIWLARLLGLTGPARADAHSEFDAGVAASNNGAVDAAIVHFTKAIQLRPDWAEAYNNRGSAYDDKGLHDQTIADTTKAIQLKPDLVEAYAACGNAYGAKGLHDQVIADYTKAIELKPDYADAYYNRGIEYEKLGQRDKAIADYRQTLSLNSGMKEAQDGLKRLGAN